MTVNAERDLLIRNVAADLADISGFGTPAYRKQFEERARDIVSQAFGRMKALEDTRDID